MNYTYSILLLTAVSSALAFLIAYLYFQKITLAWKNKASSYHNALTVLQEERRKGLIQIDLLQQEERSLRNNLATLKTQYIELGEAFNQLKENSRPLSPEFQPPFSNR